MELADKIDKTIAATPNKRRFGNNGPTNSWFRRFKQRNKLSVRTAENKSVARYDAEESVIVDDFFEKYSKIVRENDLSPSQIFNMDETGFQVVCKSPKLVVKEGELY
jgi:hypothetical protein